MKPDPEDVTEEIWECQIPGRIWVEVRDLNGTPRSLSVKGVDSRLRLSTGDRLRNQERVVDPKLDPFLNGMLLRVDKGAPVEPASPDSVSLDELRDVFQLELDDFREYVEGLSEVNVRKLKGMAKEVEATVNQVKFLDDLIEEKYPVSSGDTAVWREMQQASRPA